MKISVISPGDKAEILLILLRLVANIYNRVFEENVTLMLEVTGTAGIAPTP